MSINRCRNVFTLSDYHFPPLPPLNSKAKLKRRQNADVFEKDPFKIQSYKFHYADRPTFPMPALPKTYGNRSASNDCSTFFYNDDFVQNSNEQKNNDSRSTNITKFQEYRRKKYLQDASLSRNLASSSSCSRNNSVMSCAIDNNKSFKSNLLDLYYGNQKSTQQYKLNADQSSAKFVKSYYPYVAKNNVATKTYQKSVADNFNIQRRESKERTGSLAALVSSSNGVNGNSTRSHMQRSHQSLATSSRKACNNRRRSSSSGCEINININSMDDDSRSENVIIKIETESKNRSISSFNKPRLERPSSTPSFFIDKRLSKFSLSKIKEEQVNPSRMQPDRDILRDKKNKSKMNQVKLLTAVYSPQLLQTKPKSLMRLPRSRERLASMLPFQPCMDWGSYHDKQTNDILPQRISNPQSVDDNMGYSLTNTKNHTKSKHYYNSPSCSYNVSANENKLLNDRQSFLKMFDSSTHALHKMLEKKPKVTSLYSLPVVERSHSKLPINVNINVFTDKLKVLKT